MEIKAWITACAAKTAEGLGARELEAKYHHFLDLFQDLVVDSVDPEINSGNSIMALAYSFLA